MNTIESVDLSVILVNWNSLELTSQALSSLEEKTRGINYEVIVIDNGTTKDASPAELPKRFPWITFIANPDNRGFSKACNQGIGRARGRYLLLLNCDTIQIENALGEAVKYMDEHEEVGALGIQHLNDDATRSVQASFFKFPQPRTEILSLLGLSVRRRAPQWTIAPPEQDVDWACGSFLLMRRDCLERVGGLDERFFIYDEDIDWCLRANQTGWKVRFWPGASMIHVGSATHPFMKDKTFAHFRSHLSYIRKNHSTVSGSLYYAAMGVRLTGATILQALSCLAGRATLIDLRQRYERQKQFLLLRSSRTGC
ncbi:MAG TPA: glycosyltransferase family 2 protein [Pyrinomonadaceae bacterium]|jgi:hypothetical protein